MKLVFILKLSILLTFFADILNSSRILNSFHHLFFLSDESCKDGTCSINNDDFSARGDLESKVLSEWKAATNQSSSLSEEHLKTVDLGFVNHTAIDRSSEYLKTEFPDDLEEKVNELTKLGYSSDDSRRALQENKFEVVEAATMLSAEDEQKELLKEQVKELVSIHGMIIL